MDGKRFIEVARMAVDDVSEEWQRTAAGRAYFALFLEARDALLRWGISGLPSFQAHAFVRTRFQYAIPPDLKLIGNALVRLSALRAEADYETAVAFTSPFQVERAIDFAEDTIAQLDAIDADAARRSAAVAAIGAIP